MTFEYTVWLITLFVATPIIMVIGPVLLITVFAVLFIFVDLTIWLFRRLVLIVRMELTAIRIRRRFRNKNISVGRFKIVEHDSDMLPPWRRKR